ncbi:Myosin light chain kinase, smooth muscle [Sesbania bispinosa]|nr:Myosin light chain kinase, smooth muscle [Sesbania bispinosa]
MKVVDTTLHKLNVKTPASGPKAREEASAASGPKASEEPRASNKPNLASSMNSDEGIRVFAGNSKTTLNIEKVSPNHFCFIDEAKPPNPNEQHEERAGVELDRIADQRSEDMDESSV